MATDKHASSTNPDTIRALARLEQGFMVPSITFGDCWEVSADHGSIYYVPAELTSNPADLQQYVEATIDVDDEEEPIAELKRGVFMAKLSAPGYMDQTDLAVCKTLAAAEDYLAERYGEDEDDEED